MDPNELMANKNTLRPKKVNALGICKMQDLRRCIDMNQGSLKTCGEFVNIFEETCDKRVGYLHEMDGLDDARSPMFTGRKLY